MGLYWNDALEFLLLPEEAGSKPEPPSDSRLLEEEAGCPVVISGGRRMTAPPWSANRCAAQALLGLVP